MTGSAHPGVVVGFVAIPGLLAGAGEGPPHLVPGPGGGPGWLGREAAERASREDGRPPGAAGRPHPFSWDGLVNAHPLIRRNFGAVGNGDWVVTVLAISTQVVARLGLPVIPVCRPLAVAGEADGAPPLFAAVVEAAGGVDAFVESAAQTLDECSEISGSWAIVAAASAADAPAAEVDPELVGIGSGRCPLRDCGCCVFHAAARIEDPHDDDNNAGR